MIIVDGGEASKLGLPVRQGHSLAPQASMP